MNDRASKQLSAYTNTQQQGESLRETEARALFNCANKLQAAQAPGTRFEVYVEAIRHNQQLWTLFQVLLVEPDNPLPRDLRITLLNLSRFVDKVSLRASAEFNPRLLDSLIDINRQLATGLSARQATAAAPAAPISSANPASGAGPAATGAAPPPPASGSISIIS